MKISCVTMVRNEGDIIGAFCRHLSALFDAIVVIDHASVDGTREYLQHLTERDGRFHLYDFVEPAYEQSRLLNFAVKNLSPLSDSDWIFLLDADEFLPFSDGSDFRSHLAGCSEHAVAFLHWCNVIPTDYTTGPLDIAAPVWRPKDLSPYRKVAFQLKKLPTRDFWITQGNHDILDSEQGTPIVGATCDFPLLHVPIRSVDQFCLKLAQGISSYSLRTGSTNKQEGFHWSNIYDVSRDSGLVPPVLNWVGVHYGLHLDSAPQHVSDDDLIKKGYRKEVLSIAQDARCPQFAPRSTAAEVLFRLCAGFAEDSRRRVNTLNGDVQQLTLDDRNLISMKVHANASLFSSLPDTEWPSNPELDAAEGLDFLGRFLRPAVWPVKCLPQTAWGGHIPFMFCLVAALKPRRYVELGTHHGASFFAACQAAQRSSPQTECIAVDLWTGDEHAGHYGESVFSDFADQVDSHFKDVASYVRESFDDAVRRFEPQSIDLLHIDGLHTYEAVKHDFETWRDCLTPDGVVIFHDINVHERDFGVWEYWEELRKRFPAIAFYHSHGLGVLCMGSNANNPILRLTQLLEESKPYQSFTQWLLQNIGELTVQRATLDAAQKYTSTCAEENSRLKMQVEQLHQKLGDSELERERVVSNGVMYSEQNSRLKLQVEQLNQKLADSEVVCLEEISRLQIQVEQLNQKQREIYTSTSWKLTAPLRYIVTRLGQFARKD